MKSTSTRIKEIRNGSGLSQTAFGNKYNIPMRTLQNWEEGAREPAAYIVDMIAKLEALESVKMTMYVLYKEKNESAETKTFTDLNEAIREMENDWAYLSRADQKQYDLFAVIECGAYYDDIDEEFAPDFSEFDIIAAEKE